MENGEDLLLEVSSDGGSNFTILESWVAGSSMINETRYEVTVTVPETMLSSETVLRIRCDASSNADRVYIDDLLIETCGQSTLLSEKPTNKLAPRESTLILEEGLLLYPNPAVDRLNIVLNEGSDIIITSQILSMDGKVVRQIDPDINNKLTIDISTLDPGRSYLLLLVTVQGHQYVERFIKI